MQKQAFFLIAFAALSSASAAEIYIAERIPYQDESRIDHRITSECTKVGKIMSESIVKHAAAQGITVMRTAEPEKHDRYAKITIDSAMSAGAFISHAKGLSVYGELFQNGEAVRKTTMSRSSMGGVFGIFKSSCSVLYRTANVLGKDIAGWLATQNKQ